MGTIARGVRSPRTADPELTVLRHHDLRRAAQEPRMLVNGVAVPAPPGFSSEKEFVRPRCSGTCEGQHRCRYYDVAAKAAASFYRAGGGTNQWVFDQARMEFSDVLQYGLTYGVNFVGNYLRPPEEDVDDDNEKRLHCHVIQRLQQLRAYLFKERRNAELGDTTGQTTGDREEFPIKRTRATQLWNLMYGHTTDHTTGEVRSRSVLSSEHDSELRRHVDTCVRCRGGASCGEADELQEAATRQRRSTTRRMLASGLAALPHTEAVARLREAAQNEALCDDTRTVAQKLAAEADRCDGGCFLCRSTVKGERKLRPTLPTLPPPSEWPQADDLSTVRRYVSDVANLREPFEEKYGKLDTTFVNRYVSYRRHAARVLGLVALQPDGKVSLTDLGKQLLSTDPKSTEERGILRKAVGDSSILGSVTWFLFGPGTVQHPLLRTECSGSSLVREPCGRVDGKCEVSTSAGTPAIPSTECVVAGGDFEHLVSYLVSSGLEADVVRTSVSGVVSVTDVRASARVSRSVVTVTPTSGRAVTYTVPTRRMVVEVGQVVTVGQDLTSKTEGTARRRARTLRSWRNYLNRDER